MSLFSTKLKVLAIHHDAVLLDQIQQLCDRCHYQLTKCTSPYYALHLLAESNGYFDMMLIDVCIPYMNSHEFLQYVTLQHRIPVIVISSDGTESSVLKSIIHGACDYWVQPLHEKQFKTMWQYVARNNLNENKAADEVLGFLKVPSDQQHHVLGFMDAQSPKEPDAVGFLKAQNPKEPDVVEFLKVQSPKEPDAVGFLKAQNPKEPDVVEFLKVQSPKEPDAVGFLKAQNPKEPHVVEFLKVQSPEEPDAVGFLNVPSERKREREDDNPPREKSGKRSRLSWTPQLHQQFVNAVDQLGLDMAKPRKILKRMDVCGLTTAQVASHLQKYRNYLKGPSCGKRSKKSLIECINKTESETEHAHSMLKLDQTCQLNSTPQSDIIISETQQHSNYVSNNTGYNYEAPQPSIDYHVSDIMSDHLCDSSNMFIDYDEIMSLLS